MALETVSLIRSAVPDGNNGWIRQSASISQLSEASPSLLDNAPGDLHPWRPSGRSADPTAEQRDRWARRYAKARGAFARSRN